MVSFNTCALVFFWFATIQPGENVAPEQAMFERREQQYLANHVMATKQTDSELECGLHCLADKSCTSVNYKTSGIGKGRCELNDKTVEETSDVDDKIHHPEFNHLSVVERNPPNSDPNTPPSQTTTTLPQSTQTTKTTMSTERTATLPQSTQTSNDEEQIHGWFWGRFWWG